VANQKTISRRCIACRELIDRTQLIRVVQDHQSKAYIINPNEKQFGRSFYICDKLECLTQFSKHKKYKNTFDVDFSKAFPEIKIKQQ